MVGYFKCASSQPLLRHVITCLTNQNICLHSAFLNNELSNYWKWTNCYVTTIKCKTTLLHERTNFTVMFVTWDMLSLSDEIRFKVGQNLSDTPYWHQDVVVSWLTYISMWSVVRVTRLSGYFSLAAEAADLTLTWVLTYDSCKQPASWTTDDCSFFFKSTLFYDY